MPIYKCNNKKCNLYNKLSSVSFTRITVTEDGVLDKEAPCPSCGNTRQTVKDDGYTTAIHGSDNIPIR